MHLVPDFNDYADITFDQINVFSRYENDSTPIRIIFNEPITKTGNEVFEMSIEISITFSQTDDIPQEDIDYIVSQIE